MPFMGFSGAHGQIRVGGRVAATLGKWSLSPVDDAEQTWMFEGEPNGAADRYWLDSGGPYELRIEVGKHEWRWREVELLGTNPYTLRGQGNPEVV